MNIKADWIKDCEAEPLSLSGAIQPHGGLLHLDTAGVVTHVSANLATYLPWVPMELPGQRLPAELDTGLAVALKALGELPGSRTERMGISIAGRDKIDFVITRGISGIVIELLQHDPRHTRMAPHAVPMRTPSNAQSATELHNRVACTLHELTGFNRVMVYAFREDGDGEVLAEARRAEVYGSYLGLRFPASDIPAIARTLYKKNPWRLIPDSQGQPVALLGLQAQAPDLTWSDLRSVSPVHQSYLANMGVGASLSLPLMVGAELWGLIACHHAVPRLLELRTLRAASQVARHYALVISTWVAESRMRFIDKLDGVCMALQSAMLEAGDLISAMPDIAPGLFQLFDASGLAVKVGNVWAHTGDSPNTSALERLSGWFESAADEGVKLIDSLSRTLPETGSLPVAGAVVVKLKTPDDKTLQLWLFRKELVQEVQWGGNPNKPIEFNQGRIGVAPRRSFEKWVEKRRGYSSPWLAEDRLAAKRLRQLLIALYA
jgi:light-regulated signal transduction histidine kinase (bacteriophytochrome)